MQGKIEKITSVNFGIFLDFEYQCIGTISTYFTAGSLRREKEAADPDKGHPNWFPGSSIFFVAKTFIKILTSGCHNSKLNTGNNFERPQRSIKDPRWYMNG